MSWVAVAIGGSAALSAGAGIYGSQQAADASAKGSKNALAEQRRQYDTGLTMLEPTRALGYGAQSDLASLYGYALPGYTPLGQLNGQLPNVPIKVKANQGSGGGNGLLSKMPNPSPLAGLGHNPLDYLGGSDKPKSYGGMIDPRTGTVDVKGAGAKKDALMTNYLRTGEWTGGKGGRMANLRSTVDGLREGGYEYGAEPPQQAGPIQGGQPGNFDRFFASPDYEFRRSEGTRGIEQSAAARTGASGGNVLRDLAGYNSGLASGEYGNYFNRLLGMAGMGQTATQQGVQIGQNYGNSAGALQQQMGDSRASGIMGAYNSGANALNSGLNNWMLYKGGYFNRPPMGG